MWKRKKESNKTSRKIQNDFIQYTRTWKHLLNSIFVSSSVITEAHNDEPEAPQNPRDNVIINSLC